MIKDLIQETRLEWLEAKSLAADKARNTSQTEYANRLAACRMFSGEESLAELVDLMFSPQGREFVTRYSFPDLKTFRRYMPYNPEELGIYIDSKRISLHNKEYICLVGKTQGELVFDNPKSYHVMLLHGAKASIKAKGYAVVKVDCDSKSRVTEIKVEGNAKIFGL